MCVKIFFPIIMGLLCACTTTQGVSVETKTVVNDRIVEVSTPADSSWLKALIQCNEDGQVVMLELEEWKSKGWSSEVSQRTDSGKLTLHYQVLKSPSTVQVKVRDSLVYQQVPIYVPGPVQEVNVLSKWQLIQIYLGRILMALVIVIGLKWKM